MFLHLVPDHSLLNRFIELTKEVSDETNHKFVIVQGATPMSTPVRQKIKYTEVLCCRQNINELNKLVGGIENYERVYLHFLSDFHCDIVNQYSGNKIKFYWMFWGADLYLPMEYFKHEIFDGQSLNYYNKQTTFQATGSKFLDTLKYIKRKFLSKYFSRISRAKRLRAIPRIDYFCHYSKHDYELALQYYNLQAEFKPFFYYDMEYDKIKVEHPVEIEELKNISIENKQLFLIGHSASLTNNHLSVIDFLSNRVEDGQIYVCPLSYGDINYTGYLSSFAFKKLKGQFIPITRFLEKAEYISLLHMVDGALMNHIRSEAAGNVFILLALNKKIWVNEKSTLYLLLKELGIKLLAKNNLTENIPEADLLYNEKLIIERFNRNVALEEVRSLYS